MAVLFSILAVVFFFQNCSGSGIGTGGGSGSGEAGSGPQPVECREGFVGVPGNDFYGTKDFCVMKYEAKAVSKDDDEDYSEDGCSTDVCPNNDAALSNNDWRASSVPANKPWVRIDHAQAVKACEDSELQLITNDHWQTIARNIESVDENWSKDDDGERLALNRGHSDLVPPKALVADDDSKPCEGTGEEDVCDGTGRSQKRTHTLSNRGKPEVIWDIGGNVWEWVKDYNGTWDDNGNHRGGSDYGLTHRYISQLPTASDRASLTGGTTSTARTAKDQFGPSGEYSHLNDGERGGLGYFGRGTVGGVLRGGNWAQLGGGVFATELHVLLSDRTTDIGFRCFYPAE